MGRKRPISGGSRNVRLSPSSDRIAAPQYGDAKGQQQASEEDQAAIAAGRARVVPLFSTRSDRPETVRARSRRYDHFETEETFDESKSMRRGPPGRDLHRHGVNGHLRSRAALAARNPTAGCA